MFLGCDFSFNFALVDWDLEVYDFIEGLEWIVSKNLLVWNSMVLVILATSPYPRLRFSWN